jgi:uncharacterized lipoprotein YajG
MKGEMKKQKSRVKNNYSFSFQIFLFISYFLFSVSCGYHMVGSRPLPFESVTINQVKNMTYEPKLEEKLHNALSNEFISQGIRVMAINGDVELNATVTTFQLATIAHIDEKVQEQLIILKVDVDINDEDRAIQFRDMQSPIKITFKTTGTVSESAAEKERATDKAFSEIAREIISKGIIRYAK